MPKATVADTAITSGTSDLAVDELTRQANVYLEKNNYEQAYPYVRRLAEQDGADAHAANTAGLIALLLRKKSDAAEHFRRARDRAPDDFDANYNLALLDVSEGRHNAALKKMEELSRLHPENASLHNDMGVIWSKKGNVRRALPAFEKALNLDPDFSKARDNCLQFIADRRLYAEGQRMLSLNAKHPRVSETSLKDIDKWRSKIKELSAAPDEKTGDQYRRSIGAGFEALNGKKIAFFASQPTFIADMMRRVSGVAETRSFQGQTVREMSELMRWADVAWFDWCDQLIIEATKLPKACPIVCRLHSYEAFTDLPNRVDWSKVDHLVFVNESVREILLRRLSLDVPVSIIHNGVDTARFTIPTNKSYGRKIASVGYINYKKNPALLLYCFKKIYEHDPGYSLHVAGQHQDPRIQLYMEHFLRQNPLPVHFDGWVDDMPAWYTDKDFIISTSLFESFHYSVAEGMASGLLPLIHDWSGATNLYPAEFVFSDPDGCLELLRRLEECDRKRQLERNRQFIIERYGSDRQFEQVQKLLVSVLNRVNASQ